MVMEKLKHFLTFDTFKIIYLLIPFMIEIPSNFL